MFVLACFTVNESSSLTSGSRLYVWAIIADSISLKDDISWSLRITGIVTMIATLSLKGKLLWVAQRKQSAVIGHSRTLTRLHL